MYRPADKNLITDIAGLRVGHATDEAVRSGVTALLCGGAWVAGVDVRGGGPGGRETDALSPENLVGRAHAVVLAGGSVFGLAAADGVAANSHRAVGGAARSQQWRGQELGADSALP
jgi:L-aminopeptidase/D-esterase-like protein